MRDNDDKVLPSHVAGSPNEPSKPADSRSIPPEEGSSPSRKNEASERQSILSRVASKKLRHQDPTDALSHHRQGTPSKLASAIVGSRQKGNESRSPVHKYRLGSGNLGEKLQFKGEDPLGLAIGVMGVGGSGATTIAMALAQSFAGERRVNLVDLVVEGSQRMYHDVDAMQPGITEAIAGRRLINVGDDYFERFKIPILERGYLLTISISHQSQLDALRRSDLADTTKQLKATSDITIFDLDPNFAQSTIRDFSTTTPTAPTEAALAEIDGLILVVNEDFRSLHIGSNLGRRLIEEGFDSSTIAIVNNNNHQATPSPIRQIKKLPEIINDFSKIRGGSVKVGASSDSSLREQPPLYLEVPFAREVARIHDDVRPFNSNFIKKLAPLLTFCLEAKQRKRTNSNDFVDLQRVAPRTERRS